MKTYSRFQLYQFLKAFFVMFIGLTVLLAITTAIFHSTISGIQILLALNIIVSLTAGYIYYRNRYALSFSYDGQGFVLKEGKEEREAAWSRFDAVSLYHTGYGDLNVRVYQGTDFLDIPASALKIDASDLRFEVMEFIKKEGKDE